MNILSYFFIFIYYYFTSGGSGSSSAGFSLAVVSRAATPLGAPALAAQRLSVQGSGSRAQAQQ